MPKTDILGFQELSDILGIGLTSCRTYHSRAEHHRKLAAETGDKSYIRPILQIHDELLFEAVPEELDVLKAIVVEEMENVIKLSVPLTVECNYGTNWLESH